MNSTPTAVKNAKPARMTGNNRYADASSGLVNSLRTPIRANPINMVKNDAVQYPATAKYITIQMGNILTQIILFKGNNVLFI